MNKTKLIFIAIVLLAACNKEILYEECNGLVGTCSGNSRGEYCLFGYKWGEQSVFEETGPNAVGPGTSGGIISYSFQTEIQKISTHNYNGISTLPFDRKGDCARDMMKEALMDYENTANLSFLEEEDDQDADIKFYVYEAEDPTVGYPNYNDVLCSQIGGNIIFNNRKINNCNSFYILALHEIGHVLGLGHTNSSNVMSQSLNKYNFDGLQAGDIEGITSIYGKK